MDQSNQSKDTLSGNERPAVTKQKTTKKSRLTALPFSPKTGLVLLLVIALGFFAWQYHTSRQEIKRLSDPQVAVKKDATALKDKVSQLVELPNEEPTIATVKDPAKLKDQVFFQKSQKGDKVLIFTNARRAVLYRPSTNKVIEYAPVNIGNTTP